MITLLDITSDATTPNYGPSVDTTIFNKGIFVVKLAGLAGTNPSIQVVLQFSFDNGVTWESMADSTFSTLIAPGESLLSFDSFTNLLRAEAVLTGAGASATYKVIAYLK